MSVEVTARNLQTVARLGFDRGRRYRRSVARFIREFVGQYYRNERGLTGDEPINLIFHTIRTLVPNLVMRNPINELTTTYTPQKAYGELLGLAIDETQRAIKFKDTLRAWIVAALFGWGIMKVGIAAKGETLFVDDIRVDPGEVYVKLVGIDDFIIDPVCTDINETTFKGSRIRVPRQIMLDTDGYNHDLVVNLPLSKYNYGIHERIEELSKQNVAAEQMYTMQDYVDVVELWVPEAKAIVTIPDPTQTTTDDYLRVIDYYGPDTGPYTELSFTPPVPKNPYPICPVSIWYDLHMIANRMLKKMMDGADRRKDVLLFPPNLAEEAQDILEAKDGDTVACSDPKSIAVVSFGGQNQGDDAMLRELQTWYNYISGNPDQMAGNQPQRKGGKESATKTTVLQTNANISVEDARDITYDRTAEVSEKIGWYLHTDPLINLPLTKRVSGGEYVQLYLTPEQRTGDFLRFIFRIKQRSMSVMDPAMKSKRVMEFVQSVVPSIANTAMIFMQMGQPFNVTRAITQTADEMGILEEIQDWMVDPEFERKMLMYMQRGPQDAGKAGIGSSAGIMQNGGLTTNMPAMSAGQEFNQNVQMGSAETQSVNQGVY